MKKNIFALLLATLPFYLSSFSCPISGEASVGYEHFRSIPDGDWSGNSGALTSLNFASILPYYTCLNFQMGASYGIYDWAGRGSSPSNLQQQSQQQLFFTSGISYPETCGSGFNFGAVVDWLWASHLGVFSVNTNLGQLRLQGGYQIYCDDEFGLWGTLNINRSHASSQNIPLTFRAISQINLFWRHTFSNCSEATVWIGLPYKSSLSFGGRFKAPICNGLWLSGYMSYMAPHASASSFKSRYYGTNVCLELTYTFGNSCIDLPYMPVADNTNFLMDTNLTF